MEKKIKLKSRERINNWLEPYGENSYLLRSELDHIRVGRDKENKKVVFIDPPWWAIHYYRRYLRRSR